MKKKTYKIFLKPNFLIIISRDVFVSTFTDALINLYRRRDAGSIKKATQLLLKFTDYHILTNIK